VSRSQKYSFARSSKKSGGSFHWLLALALLLVMPRARWQERCVPLFALAAAVTTTAFVQAVASRLKS